MNISEKLFERYETDFSYVKLEVGGYQNFSELYWNFGGTMNKAEDLTGQKFGRLTVIKRDMTDLSKRSSNYNFSRASLLSRLFSKL